MSVLRIAGLRVQVAGSVCGSPESNEKVEPCFGHSISRSSSHTSPSESE